MREVWLRKVDLENGDIGFVYYDRKPDKYDFHLVDFKMYEEVCYDFQRQMNALDIAKQYFFRALAGVGMTRKDVSNVLEMINKELKK